jgi:hypothetical protein
MAGWVKFDHGPTGNIITGSVMDCNKNELEKRLKAYDKKLYIKWNPRKLKGWGLWEVRREPEKKRLVYKGEYQGVDLYMAEYVEMDVISHVLDVPILNYRVIDKIKKMDTWGDDKGRNWVDRLESQEATMKEKLEAKSKEDMRYNLKQHAKEWRDFAKFVSEGGNPGQILSKMKL